MRLTGNLHTAEYLRLIGIRELPPLTSPLDAGYDPSTLESHLDQSSHLMATLKISMACLILANETATRRKTAAAKSYNVPTVIGSGPFGIAVAQNRLPVYLDLCADMCFTRIECASVFAGRSLNAAEVVKMAEARGLEVQVEIEKKDPAALTSDVLEQLIAEGKHWLDAGALELVVEASNRGAGASPFDWSHERAFCDAMADRLAHEFGLTVVMFKTATNVSQFAFLDHFGPQVRLSNVRLEDLLNVEIYRRGLYCEALASEKPRTDWREAKADSMSR
jgi:phosphosulfolactate synthase